jgi:hypothetical protein
VALGKISGLSLEEISDKGMGLSYKVSLARCS